MFQEIVKTTSRSEYVAKNTAIALVMQLVKNLLGFVSRTIFVKILGAEYLGVNGLFSDILTMLSFAELGVGNAMVFSLYKPLAENDQKKIRTLMRLYEKAYRIIGIVIAILGVCVVPFLKFLVGDVLVVKENIVLLYLLFLLNSIISYFFAYKKSLIIADQKNYVVEIYQQFFYAIQILLQSIFLIVTKEFISYLVIVILITFINNLFMARKADKMYPFIKDKEVIPLTYEEGKTILGNVKALVVYKIGGIILESTDSVFISIFLNVSTVGLYSNYKLIVNVFKTIGNKVMDSVISSIGNLNASNNAKQKEHVFKEMFYVNAWFYGFTAGGLCIFITPLVEIWLGKGFILSFNAVFAAIIYYYIANMHYPCYTYRTTAGLFIFGKYVPIIASIINIALNLFLVKKFGLSGILWASTISRIVTYEIIDPILVYKHVFQRDVMNYFKMYLFYGCLVLGSNYIGSIFIDLISYHNFFWLTIKAIVFTIVYNVIFFCTTIRTNEFRALYKRFKNVFYKRTK